MGSIVDMHGRPFAQASSSGGFGPLYEGASTADRIGTWGLSPAGPNVGQNGIIAIKKRSRQSERNNPTANGAIDAFVSNLVGTAISPAWQIDNLLQKEELESLWQDSQKQLDYVGFTDFYGQLELICRSMVRDGEGLAVIHELQPSLDNIVPIQIQPLESDHLDPNFNDISPEGNEIRFAIEWKAGKRYRYWLYDNHPGEVFLCADNIRRIPVPAADVLHVFRLKRAGQCRGSGWLGSVITKLHDIDVYDDAELVRKKAAALWGGFIYQDNQVASTSSNPFGGTPGARSNGVQSIELKAGHFPVLRDGMKIAFSESADVGNNYKEFMKTQFRLIARGIGITYEQLTGDLEGVTYSSIRSGLIEFRRLCETIIARTLVFQYCRPIVDRWIRAAILNGCLKTITPGEYLANPRLFHRVDWHPHGWDFTDPVKDRVAELMDIRSGIKSRRQVVAKRNGSVEVVDRENREDLQRAVDNGLVYDCYPGQTTGSGAIQKVSEQVILQSLETK
ncbi:phage portal protein [Desulfotalea psychrophila]|uniref:Related to portal protein GPB of phage lambda n=1 Tax=Desulfotalea psychrophila (strain LSv54 / DSM 12343) TaxID=177439 RepID=Q6AMW3_DESPS|nr:phage portal protein [Desulfotalea psychrophila]CAG36311.1 related to portal protein GPB of phage lambda [Desulfotalea psychrophila LSv54]